MKSIQERHYALVPLLLFCGYFTIKALALPLHDIANYYFGGRLLSDGKFSSEIYFPYWFNTEIAKLGFQQIFASFAPNTPFLALFFSPFSYLDPPSAKALFNILTTILLLYSISRLAQFYKIKPYYLLLIPAIFCIPLRNNLMFGQVYFLLFFLLSESWLAYQKGHVKKMALFLAIAVMLKVFPALLLIILLLKKSFKGFFLTIGACVLLILLSLPFCDPGLWFFYFTKILSKASCGEIVSAYADNYQSVFMFLKRLFVFDHIENPNSLFDHPAAADAILLGFKILLLSIGWYVTRKERDNLKIFSYWIFAAILFSPYGSTYTFILLLFPFFSIAGSNIAGWKKLVVAGLLIAICNLPLALFLEQPFPLSYTRMFLFVALFGIFVSFSHVTVNWKKVALAAMLPLLFVLVPKGVKPNNDRLLTDTPALVYDYTIKDEKLTYFFWSEVGASSNTIPLASKKVVRADLNDGQVYFYGKRITSGDATKLKPMVVNDSLAIYLSDAGRGIGFYTLRICNISTKQ